jgi:hypothetical protein
MVTEQIGYQVDGMKTTKLLSLAVIGLVTLSQPALAAPHGGRGRFAGGHFVGASSSRGHFGGFAGGGIRAAPAFSGDGARFSGGSVGAVTRVPQQFYYYGGARTSGLRQHAFVQHPPPRSTTRNTLSRATVTRQQNRTSSTAGRGRVSNPRTSTDANRLTAANRQSFIKNHASVRHDPTWHRTWDRHHAHFHEGKVFVFINGFWWGLEPRFYPYYACDYYPYDYHGYPYDYYSGYYPYNYSSSDYSYANGAIVSEVQSDLAQTPLGRVGQTDDIGPAAVFFASDDSKWITGETLLIAGGLR